MIGLLRKELYGLNSLYKKQLPLVAALYAVLVLSTGQDFFLYFGVWMMLFYSVSGLSLDDSCGWGRYARTLPVTSAQVVGAKFLASLVYMAIALVYGAVLGVLHRLVNSGGAGGYGQLFGGLAVVSLVAMVMVFALYPFAFKYGVEKARNGLLVVWAVLFGGFFLLGDRLDEILPLETVSASLEQSPLLWLAGAVVLALALIGIFFAASCRIYGKKEF